MDTSQTVVPQKQPQCAVETASLPEQTDMNQASNSEGSAVKSVPSQAALLNSSVQELIGAINDKRKRDLSLLADFKNDLEMKCGAFYSTMENTVYATYEETNTVIEGKLQELLQVIDRIGQLETELSEFKSAFSALYTDLHV